MPLSLSIDLSDATFADLRALVDAAHTAGVDSRTRGEIEDTTLLVTIDSTAERKAEAEVLDPEPETGARPAFMSSTGQQLGDAAIRSVIDILTGRQEPPRRTS